jgi:uncharacterized protein YecT (DUF1311 family)
MSSEGFESADNALNAEYRGVLAKLNKPDWSKEKQRLIESQRAWLSFRDKQCALMQELGGGAGRATEMDCKAELTQERTAFLKRLSEGF